MKLTSKNKTQIFILLLPGLLTFAIFTIYPIIKLFVMSFFEWDFGSIFNQRFIGLENYAEVLGDKYFRMAFTNTLLYTVVTVPGQMIIGLFIALFLNQSFAYRSCKDDPEYKQTNDSKQSKQPWTQLVWSDSFTA